MLLRHRFPQYSARRRRAVYQILCFPYWIIGRCDALEDMISKILDMDKKARDLTDAAVQSKVNYENEIIHTKEKIKNDYIERANERIKINTRLAQKTADEKLAALEKKNAAIIDHLDKENKENRDRWVNEIVQRVISGQI